MQHSKNSLIRKTYFVNFGKINLSLFLVYAILFALLSGCANNPKTETTEPTLKFIMGSDGEYTFDTGILKGVLRKEGKSNGIIPAMYKDDSISFSAGEGLYNHYRVFTYGKRYGYGARRWPSTAELNDDGSVDVFWPSTEERPFELHATYTLETPNTIDLLTTVKAIEKLEAFEVFLASYYAPSFTDSRVYTSSDPKGENEGASFVFADKELGEWLAFPRDEKAAEVINDGRWDLEPHPLYWTMMPKYELPVAIRRDVNTGLTVVSMTKIEDCFGIFTPYGEEKHISNYLSVFGYDIEAGKSASAHSRIVVLENPTDKEILDIANEYLKE
jgi:hypothetical protein